MEFQKEEYSKVYKKINRKVAIAIFCILFGFSIVLLGAEYLEEGQMIWVVIFFLAMLVVSFGCILKVGIDVQKYREQFPQIPDIFSEEEKRESKKKWKKICLLTGVLTLLGLLVILFVYAFRVVNSLSLLPVAMLFFCLSLLLPQVGYWKLECEKMDIQKYNKEKEEQDRKKVKICSLRNGNYYSTDDYN